ncbi:phospho-N-acetylmuramoyl-pentapeptide-transferase [Thermosediminibacter litoriperuensis]|uniref:Phospho-N-acetylmuramoyl-pentapeptide-transferase n=1 Tax=Thermosediminibacter litoriperuensis TaxID=291989 RepID=A0A5S5ASV9_9FIRM|nr:phospho-N-acetylmuramoyl-pentapeptide-transferase [Thermosediminibacter litoriperuensis]TYP54945.1 phospho-N-acetylmuramoyl-pentapeptide-transferase [Thermosediminibacter litoriperuensis]
MKTAFLAAAAAFTLVALLGIFVIPMLAVLKFGQTVRSDGPKRHLKKTGTPTMGGIMIIPAIILSTLFFYKGAYYTLMALLATAGFALIGFADDYIKVVKKRSLGLRASQKLLFQVILSIILAFFAFTIYPGTTKVFFPFIKGGIDLGLLYIPFTIFVVLGTVNSVNLTDGLDGLVSGIVVVVGFAFTLISFFLGKDDLALFSAAVSGACLGFLLYNRYPARVFMGDTGSLGLGGAISALTVLSGTHFYLAFIGLIFILETLSVILQVFFFRTTGKRIFRMSPLHHHFELGGWSEVKVVTVFWIFTGVSALLGIALFYLTGVY